MITLPNLAVTEGKKKITMSPAFRGIVDTLVKMQLMNNFISQLGGYCP